MPLVCSVLAEHPDQLLLNQAHIGERGKGPHTASARGASRRLVLARAAVSRSGDKDEVAGTVGAFDVLGLRNGTLGIG